ncbi:sugar transferase [Desulfovibrio mangrovi]|uniref:sugar transferase n=1 Tax=Desulfovibrio mangrovi TaxID=2976983 RepID=UPI0023DFA57C|nr:sugar transferase [Desulfovibrio mangrovi]
MHVVLTGQCALSILTEQGPLLRAIREAGHEATVVAPFFDDETRFALHSENVRAVESGNPATGISSLRTIASFFSLWRILRALQPDIVLSFGLKQSTIGSLAAWLARVNRIYALPCGTTALQEKGALRRRLRARLCGTLCKLALSACRSVFFQTPEERAFFRDKGILPSGTANRLLNGTGVDLTDYPFSPLPDSASEAAGSGEMVFTCIAPLDREGGLEEFVEAARLISHEYPEARFRLAGTSATGNPISDSDLSLWKTWMEIEPQVMTPRELLAESTVFVLPGCRNGLPHAALAALATGRPIIATDAAACREIVLDGANGFIVPAGNASAMAEAMRRCMRERDSLAAMGEASRRYAEERFDARQVCRAQLKEMHLAHTGPETPLPQTVLGDRLKRAFDLAVTIPALVVFLPVIGLLALRVRSGISRDIFFRQPRPGRNAKEFRILKFKTMSDATDADGNLLPDADRLTPLGKRLRAASLDELPELWNVITGDMSLVGPRPLLPQYLERYSPRQARRHEVRPGITGWAQVNGRNITSWEERFEKDVWYVENHGILLDIKILFLTVWTVLRREGVTAPGHPTCPEFMGSPTEATNAEASECRPAATSVEKTEAPSSDTGNAASGND